MDKVAAEVLHKIVLVAPDRDDAGKPTETVGLGGRPAADDNHGYHPVPRDSTDGLARPGGGPGGDRTSVDQGQVGGLAGPGWMPAV